MNSKKIFRENVWIIVIVIGWIMFFIYFKLYDFDILLKYVFHPYVILSLSVSFLCIIIFLPDWEVIKNNLKDKLNRDG